MGNFKNKKMGKIIFKEALAGVFFFVLLGLLYAFAVIMQ